MSVYVTLDSASIANSKRCMTFTTDVQIVRRLQRHKLHQRVYREKIRTVEELQQRIILEKWQRLDQHIHRHSQNFVWGALFFPSPKS